MRLELPYPPSANRYWRHVGSKVLLSAEARAYRLKVQLLAKSQKSILRPLAGPLSVFVDVHRPRRAGDLDNSLKQLLDALRGVAFEDDSQIVELHAFRHDDKQNPRAVVRVEPLHVGPEWAERSPDMGDFR